MARQGIKNDNDTTGPESSMALDDVDIVSVKVIDPLNMTIPMTGSVVSPFATPNTEATQAFPVRELPDFEDEKTVKVRIPNIAQLNAEPVDKLNMTVTGLQPVDASPKPALPFRENAPGAPVHFRPPGGAPPTADFTGTLTLSLDQQVRAEIQRITPFQNSSEALPKTTHPAAPIYEPQYVPAPPLTDIPDVFRSHLREPLVNQPLLAYLRFLRKRCDRFPMNLVSNPFSLPRRIQILWSCCTSIARAFRVSSVNLFGKKYSMQWKMK
jgi:hypothetical protein